MSLKPAVRHAGRIHVGTTEDSHETIMEAKGLDSGEHGFVSSDAPKRWLSRKDAVSWLKRSEPKTYVKVKGKLPPEGLHSHIYAAAKGAVQKITNAEKTVSDTESMQTKKAPQAVKVDLKTKTVIIYDRGLYTYMAEFLARYFGKVIYHKHNSEVYPQGVECQVGQGIPGVEWAGDFWSHVDEADVIFFPYCFDGGLQVFLRSKGYKVCGSGRAEKIEHDKQFLKEKLKEIGMPTAPDHEVTGLDDLESYLDGKKGPFVVKSCEPYRGDWETHAYKNPREFKCYVDNVRHHVGPERAKKMRLLVESWVESECESGCDGFMLDGEMAPWPTISIEIKDEGAIVRGVKTLPDIIGDSMGKMVPVYQELTGYAGPYSNEMRFTDDGKVYRTDETCRCGNPPTTAIIEMYGEQYAQAIYALAHGEMPSTEKPEFEYGAEIVLQSTWYIKNALHVGCPDNFSKHLKLNNMYMVDGQRYCDPVRSQDDVSYFGSIVAVGHTLKEATDTAMEKIKELEIYKLHYTENIFGQSGEVLATAKKFGINF
jgi:hypothetical protein